MLVAYYRVSTPRQGASGLGLDAQREAVGAYAARVGRPVVAAYTEVESGRSRVRPQLAAAVAHARAAKLPLVVAKLDRLARDTGFLLSLLDSGVQVVFLDLPELGTDPITGRLLITVMAAFAEFEARRIRERILAVLARRRARGDVMGWQGTRRKKNPLTRRHQRAGTWAARDANRAAATAYRTAMRPVVERLRAQGKTLAEVADSLNAAGYTTRRGKPWTVATVDLILRQPVVPPERMPTKQK